MKTRLAVEGRDLVLIRGRAREGAQSRAVAVSRAHDRVRRDPSLARGRSHARNRRNATTRIKASLVPEAEARVQMRSAREAVRLVATDRSLDLDPDLVPARGQCLSKTNARPTIPLTASRLVFLIIPYLHC